jgi:hypothetical protein
LPGPSLNVAAFVLFKRPPSGHFERVTLFSAELGLLSVLHRIAKPASTSVDLFDHGAWLLEATAQGDSHFVREVRILTRHSGIGRSYDALRFASAFATLITRNPLPEESRGRVFLLLSQVFTALASSPRPDIAHFKGLYSFARDEGLPLKQHWLVALPAQDREHVAQLLTLPLAAQTLPTEVVTRLTLRLHDYLRQNADMVIDPLD